MIKIVPKIGDKIIGETLPFFSALGFYKKRVEGIVEKNENNIYKVRKDNEIFEFPLHRILAFTFGGIPITNPAYDRELSEKEDREEMNRLSNLNL